MPWQTVSLKMAGGIDTKSDPKLVTAAKLLTLQNGIFTNAGRITKRNGYDNLTTAVMGGGTWSSPTMCRSYKNELLLAATISGSTGQSLLSYSQDLGAWKNVGKYVSVGVSRDTIDVPYSTPTGTIGSFQVNQGIYNTSSVVLGNLALIVYDTGYGITDGTTYITVIDLETGTHLCDNLVVSGSAGYAKAAILGTSTLAVFYTNFTSNIACRVVTVTSGGGVSLGSASTSASPCGTGDSSYICCYDFVTTSAGATIAATNITNNRVDVYSVNTSGVFTAQINFSTTGHMLPISINQDSNSRYWIFWVQNTNTLKYTVLTSAFAVLGGFPASPVTVDTVANASQVCAISASTTQQTVYYSQFTVSQGDIGVIYPFINQATVSTAGIVTNKLRSFNNLDILGKPVVSFNGTNYLPCYNLSAYTSTGFLVDLADGLTVARFLQDEAEGIFNNVPNTSSVAVKAAIPLGIRYPGFLTPVTKLSSTKLYLAAGQVSSILPNSVSTTTDGACFTNPQTIAMVMGSAAITLDFNHQDAYQALVHQDTLVLNGGFLSQYDSNIISELGYHVQPDNVTIVPHHDGAGGLVQGTYIYYVVYIWSDALGNLHQSAPSPAASVHIGAGSTYDSAIVTFPGIALTQKPSGTVFAQVFRTIANGTIAFLVSVQEIEIGTLTVSITDKANDATIPQAPSMYTQGGAILDNFSPPPSLIMWTNNNRLWCVDSENPETTIEYSKTASLGTGISFSTGLLELVIDSSKGKITGGSKMDEKTIVLKEDGLGYFFGDGANDAGTGSTITTFQFIPSDVGCTNSKSVLLYPGGVLFRTTKGIYQLTRGVQVQYIGTDVEGFNSQDIRSAVIVGNKNQIRFLTSSGSSLLYDYYFNQWSTFTNHAGLSADVWQGAYVYVRSDGSVYQENSTSFLDNSSSIAVLLKTSWLKASTVQNFQRVRLFELLGDYSSPSPDPTYGVQVSFAYDFASTLTATNPFYLASSSGVQSTFQEKIFAPRQKCDAIQIQIAELPTGASGEYFDLSDLDMEIQVKTGLNKLAATYSTG